LAAAPTYLKAETDRRFLSETLWAQGGVEFD